MFYINLTPHPINLNSGETFQPSGIIARVSSEHSLVREGETFCPSCGGYTTGYCETCGCDVALCKEPDHYRLQYGEVENLPEPREEVLLIVSALVFSASDRTDLVAPATGHPDVIRNAQGHIVSVPGFIVK